MEADMGRIGTMPGGLHGGLSNLLPSLSGLLPADSFAGAKEDKESGMLGGLAGGLPGGLHSGLSGLLPSLLSARRPSGDGHAPPAPASRPLGSLSKRQRSVERALCELDATGELTSRLGEPALMGLAVHGQSEARPREEPSQHDAPDFVVADVQKGKAAVQALRVPLSSPEATGLTPEASFFASCHLTKTSEDARSSGGMRRNGASASDLISMF